MYLGLFFLYSSALVVGTLSIYYTLQVDRTYRTRFLKPLAGYVLLWTVWIFLYQVLEFIYENILGYDCSTLSQAVLIPSTQIAFVLQAGILYLLAMLAAGLTDRSIPRKVLVISILLVVVELVMLYVGLRLFRAGTHTLWLTIATLILNEVPIVLTAAVLGYLFWAGRRQKAAVSRKNVLSLTLLLAFFYLLVNGASFLPGSLRSLSMSAGLFLFCAVPLFWIRWIYLPTATSPLLTNGERAVRQLFDDHRISEREREIINLIFKGMSNKEIEETLSISYHTVKNHIYNIFQKLGVQSRGQLINRILQTRSDTS